MIGFHPHSSRGNSPPPVPPMTFGMGQVVDRRVAFTKSMVGNIPPRPEPPAEKLKQLEKLSSELKPEDVKALAGVFNDALVQVLQQHIERHGLHDPKELKRVHGLLVKLFGSEDKARQFEEVALANAKNKPQQVKDKGHKPATRAQVVHLSHQHHKAKENLSPNPLPSVWSGIGKLAQGDREGTLRETANAQAAFYKSCAEYCAALQALTPWWMPFHQFALKQAEIGYKLLIALTNGLAQPLSEPSPTPGGSPHPGFPERKKVGFR